MDAFRAVSAAETCPGNGDFNTDVPGYQSQPLLDDGLSNAIIRSSVLELRQERVTRYLRMVSEVRRREVEGEGVDGETRENDTRERAEAREKSFTIVARHQGYGWDFRGVFGKMRQRSEIGWIVFMNCASVGKPRAVRYRAQNSVPAAASLFRSRFCNGEVMLFDTYQ